MTASLSLGVNDLFVCERILHINCILSQNEKQNVYNKYARKISCTDCSKQKDFAKILNSRQCSLLVRNPLYTDISVYYFD